MSDPHIREAAESLLSSVSPHQRTLTHSHSVNLVSEDLVAGHRPQGKMSTVRRFFCLFVTFDLLFTSLMWLICVMIRGENLEEIFKSEIINYNIKSSLFDIVMVAVSRFIVLLLFYAVLYINNWSIIALSTGCTCAFLIAKVFVFNWPAASEPVYQVFLILTSFTLSWGEAWFLDFRVLPQELQAKQWPAASEPVYQVFLILTSFTLSWGEAWFLDFRVLPQELQAKQILESIVHHGGPSERTPLLHPGQASGVRSNYAESTVKWFSPVETPESSPRPRRQGEPLILTTEQIEEYKAQAHESMVNAWRIVNLPNWTVEKKGSHKGDVVESKKTEQFGKVYRFTGVVECPPKFLYEEFKNNLTKLPEWNPTILKSELIKEIAPGIDLSYQVTAGGGRGIIAPRDFIILRCNAGLSQDGRVVETDPYSYISSGVSTTVPGYPPHRDLVRGHNKVGCWYIRPRSVQTSGGKIETYTTFQWLMCCDLKGKIPQFVLDAAFGTVMLDYIVHVRRFAADAKAKGLF